MGLMVRAVPQPRGIVYSRHDFVNEYWRPGADERRLDFQYYEHDLAQFSRVLAESYKFTKAFQDKTGFAPRAGPPISRSVPRRIKSRSVFIR